MLRLRLAVSVLAAALLAGGLWVGDNRADDKAPPVRIRGTLPRNWKKLGLTDEQRQQVYRIQSGYRAKIGELQQKIDQLRKAERADLEKVLTQAQKQRLREILTGAAPTEKGTTEKGKTEKGTTAPGGKTAKKK